MVETVMPDAFSASERNFLFLRWEFRSLGRMVVDLLNGCHQLALPARSSFRMVSLADRPQGFFPAHLVEKPKPCSFGGRRFRDHSICRKKTDGGSFEGTRSPSFEIRRSTISLLLLFRSSARRGPVHSAIPPRPYSSSLLGIV